MSVSLQFLNASHMLTFRMKAVLSSGLGFVGFWFGVLYWKGRVKLYDYKETRKRCLFIYPLLNF